jgi:hypothetical protein
VLEESRQSPGRLIVLTESAKRTGLAYALDDSLTPEAQELAAFLAWAFGASTLAVIHYGSRAQGRRTRRKSAFDFFAVVDGYSRAYRSLAATAGLHRASWLASGLARILAPNVVSLRGRTSQGNRVAKVAVLSARDFRRVTSARARACFSRARLIAQPLRSEIRPEGTDHAHELVAAQRDTLRGIYDEFLADCARNALLERDGEMLVFRLVRPKFIRYLRTRPQRRN